MDEIVIRSMARWPDIPDVYGWLALDRRGNWLLKGRSGGFERIGNKAVGEFIGRNYQHDDAGRWFFQNGPQRVFVTLLGLPLVYRLERGGAQVIAHTGTVAQGVAAAWLDDAGGMVLETELGAGTLDDRDLAEALSLVREADGAMPDEQRMLDLIAGHGGAGLHFLLAGDQVALGSVAAASMAAHFGFDANPRPPDGQPDC